MFMSSSGDKKKKKKSVQEKKHPVQVTRLQPAVEAGGVGVGGGVMDACSFDLLQLPGRRNAAEEQRLHFSSAEEPRAAGPPTKYRERSLSDGLPGPGGGVGGVTRTLSTPTSHRLHVQPAHPCKFQQTDESCEQTGRDQMSGFITR